MLNIPEITIRLQEVHIRIKELKQDLKTIQKQKIANNNVKNYPAKANG